MFHAVAHPFLHRFVPVLQRSSLDWDHASSWCMLWWATAGGRPIYQSRGASGASNFALFSTSVPATYIGTSSRLITSIISLVTYNGSSTAFSSDFISSLSESLDTSTQDGSLSSIGSSNVGVGLLSSHKSLSWFVSRCRWSIAFLLVLLRTVTNEMRILIFIGEYSLEYEFWIRCSIFLLYSVLALYPSVCGAEVWSLEEEEKAEEAERRRVWLIFRDTPWVAHSCFRFWPKAINIQQRNGIKSK